MNKCVIFEIILNADFPTGHQKITFLHKTPDISPSFPKKHFCCPSHTVLEKFTFCHIFTSFEGG